MSIVVTSADAYSALDAEHPFGSLRRVGGGEYRFVPVEGEPARFADYDSAVDGITRAIDERESDPSSQLKKALARVAVLESRLREAGVDVVAIAVDVKG